MIDSQSFTNGICRLIKELGLHTLPTNLKHYFIGVIAAFFPVLSGIVLCKYIFLIKAKKIILREMVNRRFSS